MTDQKVIFIYNGQQVIICCKKEDKMESICKKFGIKTDIDINDILFLYSGNQIDLKLTYEETINKDDLNRGEMTILIYENNNLETNENISKKKSKFIICQKCKENCLIDIKDYKITLWGCKNKHKSENLLLKEYEESQYIDESKIKCNECNLKKSETYQNKFFICATCMVNLCPLSKAKHVYNHNNNHIIVDYDKKYFICNVHHDLYTSYCEECKRNLCILCEEAHINHKIIYFGSVLPNKDNLKEEIKNFKEIINKIKEKINQIINLLNKLKDDLELFYEINSDIINNYDYHNRNYQVFQNINNVKNNINIKNYYNIINENNIENQFITLIKIYNKINNKIDNKYNVDNIQKIEKKITIKIY